MAQYGPRIISKDCKTELDGLITYSCQGHVIQFDEVKKDKTRNEFLLNFWWMIHVHVGSSANFIEMFFSPAQLLHIKKEVMSVKRWEIM